MILKIALGFQNAQEFLKISWIQENVHELEICSVVFQKCSSV